ncbi:hypothetical protein [Helicobacter felis]|nr:hypothetical protein [Helicobacter felis]
MLFFILLALDELKGIGGEQLRAIDHYDIFKEALFVVLKIIAV